MVAGGAGTGKGEMALTARETDTKVILFGNFVFLGLRTNSGMREQGDIDLYLLSEGGLKC
jgi:hypothetical protein